MTETSPPRRSILAAASVLVLAAACAPAQDGSWAARTLKAMDLRDKIGQLLFPSISPGKIIKDDQAWAELERNITEHRLGGIHVFRSQARDCGEVINRMQRTAKLPLLITADFEGGPGYILRGATRFPRGMGLAATASADLIRKVAHVTAEEGRAVGVHVNFFPVMDVNSSPANPIINLRAFGDDPGDVSRWGVAYLEALQASGMIATAKHFPGHGDTTVDSHLDLPVQSADRERLDRVELPPFRAAVNAGVQAVMSAHIAWPKVTGDPGLPATLAPQVLTGILRQEMGFGGLVFTDALPMKGLSGRFSLEDAAVRAVAAGADVLLFAQDLPRMAAALEAAVNGGRLPAAQLDAAVLRILQAKERLGLDHRRATDPGELDRRLRTREAQELAAEVVRRSFTLVRDREHRLPLRLKGSSRVLLVAAADPGESRDWEPAGGALREALKKRVGHLTVAELDAPASNLDEILRSAGEHDAVIVAGWASVAAFRGESGLSAAQAEGLGKLAAKGAVFVGLGNPYGLRGAGAFGTVLLAYDIDPLTEELAAGALGGDFPLTGRLPVTVPELGERGAGARK